MIHYLRNRLSLIAGLSGIVLGLVFLVLVTRMAQELEQEVRSKLIDRAASILQPVAQRQFEQKQAEAPELPTSMLLVSALLSKVAQEGLLAIAIFDSDGRTLEFLPAGPHFVDLSAEDYLRLGGGTSLCRYNPAFPLKLIVSDSQQQAPVLEVLVPIRAGSSPSAELAGFARYHLDGRQLEQDLATIREQIGHQTRVTLLIGLIAVAVVTIAAQLGLRRAHRQLQERNAKLVRTQVELTLAAKTSAMGQITSHLMHALKGAVAGLRAATVPGGTPDLEGVAEYTARVEAMIQDTMEILGDLGGHTNYQLPACELIRSILERNGKVAQERGVTLKVENHFDGELDNHRGSLLCLIANNLIQNALEASRHGGEIQVLLAHRERGDFLLRVSDQGRGIPDEIRERLFQPGVSTRQGGSGLGLALSRLLARQMNGDLTLVGCGPQGSSFELRIPLET